MSTKWLIYTNNILSVFYPQITQLCHIIDNTKAVHWMGCYVWYSARGLGSRYPFTQASLPVPNVTAHPASRLAH